MGRPTTKQDLIQTAGEQYDKLWKLIDSMTEAERNAEFQFGEELLQKEAHWARDKNLRDVLVHLYEWHQLLLNWVESNRGGEPRPFLPEPYNWKSYGAMNVGFWEKHQATPYDEAKALLLDSHGKVMDMIRGLSNEELFERKHFNWTGTTTVGAYCISATSSHYDWAMKKLKAHLKHQRKP